MLRPPPPGGRILFRSLLPTRCFPSPHALTCGRAIIRKAAARMRFVLRGLFGLALGLLAAMPARAQTGFDRPGGDYVRFTVQSGDPAVCSARCDRDARCRA